MNEQSAMAENLGEDYDPSLAARIKLRSSSGHRPGLDKNNKETKMNEQSAMAENLGEDFDLSLLPRIKTPKGNIAMWVLPNVDDPVKEFYAVILHKQIFRLKYKDSAGGVEAVCVAENGKTGIGTPGGACNVCPERCGKRYNLLLLRAGETLPEVLSVPITGVWPLNQHLLEMGIRGARFHQEETRFSLKVTISEGGYEYVKMQFSAGKNQINPDQVEVANLFRQLVGGAKFIAGPGPEPRIERVRDLRDETNDMW